TSGKYATNARFGTKETRFTPSSPSRTDSCASSSGGGRSLSPTASTKPRTSCRPTKRDAPSSAKRIMKRGSRQASTMSNPRKSVTTHDRWMQKPSFKKAFDESYRELLLSELVCALMAEDGRSV